MQAAARAAADRWPDVYRGPGRARLICRDDEPPSAAVIEAAKRAGVEIDAHGGAATACDAALLASRDFVRIPASLPALVAESGAAPRLAIDSGVEPALEGAPRRRGEAAASRRSDRRGAAVAAAPRRRPARPQRISKRRSEQPPASLRIRAAAAADRRAVGSRFGDRRFLGARGGGQRGGERRSRRRARSTAPRIRARRRAGARLRPALAQHVGGALVPALRRQLRLRLCRRAVPGRFARDGAAAVCDDWAALSRSACRQPAPLAGQVDRLSPRRRSRAHRPVLRARGNRAARRRVPIVGRMAAGARFARRAGGGAGGARRRGLPRLSRRLSRSTRKSPTIAPLIDASVDWTPACAAPR